jgi:hypothetical protein
MRVKWPRTERSRVPGLRWLLALCLVQLSIHALLAPAASRFVDKCAMAFDSAPAEMRAIASQLHSEAFPVAFRRVLSALADPAPLYRYAVRYRLDDLVEHYAEIPRYPGYFDLVAELPIDGAGCPVDFFSSALARASLSPVPAPSARRRYAFAFIVLMHNHTPWLAGFLSRLQGPDSVFVMVVDARAPGLAEAVQRRFASVANLYVAEPQVKMCWGCVSLTYGTWIGVQAALRLGLDCDWFSLHSAVDALLRPPEIIKAFFTRYRGKAEFVATRAILPYRVKPLIIAIHGCRSKEWVLQARFAMARIFPNWTQIGQEAFVAGSQWWTLSRETVSDLLQFMIDHPLLMRRISFLDIPDEALTQTLLKYMGLTVSGSCNLRFTNFSAGKEHPDPLTPELVKRARGRFVLFARKLPDENDTVTDFLKTVIKNDKEGDFPPQEVFERQIDPCGLKEWPRVLAMYRKRHRIRQ